MIYFITCPPSNLIKVGLAVNLKKRVSELQTGCPFPLTVIASFEGCRRVEMQLHKVLASSACRGEWFDAALVHAFLAQAGEFGFQVALEIALTKHTAQRQERKDRGDEMRLRFAKFIEDEGLNGGKRRLLAVDFLNHSRRMGLGFTNSWLGILGFEATEAPACQEAADMLIATIMPLSSAGKGK